MSNTPEAMAECPDHLQGEAREFWERYRPLLIESGTLADTDRAAFEILASTFWIWKQAHRELMRCGMIHITPNGCEQPSPLLSIVARARGDFLKYSRKFGLTPYDRGAVKTPPKEPSEAFEDF